MTSDFNPPHNSTKHNCVNFFINKLAKFVATDFWLCVNQRTTTHNCGILSQEIPSTCGQLSDLRLADCIMPLDWHDISFRSAFTKQDFGQQNITNYQRCLKLSFGTCGQLSDLKHADYCRLHNDSWLRWLLISCTRCSIPRLLPWHHRNKTVCQLNYNRIGLV